MNSTSIAVFLLFACLIVVLETLQIPAGTKHPALAAQGDAANGAVVADGIQYGL